MDGNNNFKDIDSNAKKELALTENFINIWQDSLKGAAKKASYCLEINKEGENAAILVYSFCKGKRKVVIFEKKKKVSLSSSCDIENSFKTTADDIKLYKAVMHKMFAGEWKGDYSPDGDGFFLINMPITEDYYFEPSKGGDLSVIEKLKESLTIENAGDNKCIFQLLGFEDKTFPASQNYEKGLSQTIADEIQPLVVISPVRDKNKLIIFDDKLFVRCYKRGSGLEHATNLRIVLVTVIYQRAFLEYTSNLLVNNNTSLKSKSERLSLSNEVQRQFSQFTDSFWRLDISNGFYLNKSYRIIGKVWLLNKQYEMVRQHLERNTDVEHQQLQTNTNSFLNLIAVTQLFTFLNPFVTSGVRGFFEKFPINCDVSIDLISSIFSVLLLVIIYIFVKLYIFTRKK